MASLSTWFILSFVILIASAPFGLRRGDSLSDKDAAKLSKAHRLPLPDGLRGAVTRRVVLREQSILKWGGVGLAIGLVLGFLFRDNSAVPVLVMLPTMLGITYGSYLGARSEASVLQDSAPRVARTQETTLAGYVTGPERLAHAIAVGAVLVAVATTRIVWGLVPAPNEQNPWGPIVVGATAAIGLGFLALTSWAARKAVERPQHAGSELELRWDDALRSSAVRDVHDAGIATAMVAVFVMLFTAGTWIVRPEVRADSVDTTLHLGTALFLVGVISVGVIAVVWLIGRAQKNPSRRLRAGTPGA